MEKYRKYIDSPEWEFVQGTPDIINAEKQEQVIGDFDGDGKQELMNVDGPPHSEGGKNVSVPDGSFVFSDTPSLKIKDPNILKMFGAGTKGQTPAQLAKKYNLQEAQELSDDPNNDALKRKTGELMYQNYVGKLSALANVQEGMKADKEQKKMMKMGGWALKYQEGGKTQPYITSDPNDPRIKAYNDSTALNNYSELQKNLYGISNAAPDNYLGYDAAPFPRLLHNPSEDRSSTKRYFDQMYHNPGSAPMPNKKNYNKIIDSNADKTSQLYRKGDSLVSNDSNFYWENASMSPDIGHKSIKPEYYYNEQPLPTHPNTPGPVNAYYKKPVQEVVYQPKAISQFNIGSYDPFTKTMHTAEYDTEEQMQEAMKGNYPGGVYNPDRKRSKKYGGYYADGGNVDDEPIPGAINLPYGQGNRFKGYPKDVAMRMLNGKDRIPYTPEIGQGIGYQGQYGQNTQGLQRWEREVDPGYHVSPGSGEPDSILGIRTLSPNRPYMSPYPWGNNHTTPNIPTTSSTLNNDITPLPYAGNNEPQHPQAGTMNTIQVPGMQNSSTVAGPSQRRRVKLGVPTMNPDALGDIALGLKAATLQKYKPWEPPVTAVIPETVFMDPTRELAANSEQAAMAYNSAAQSANSKAARSAGSVYQGQAIKNAADILGRYNNANVQIANQANQNAATITNNLLAAQRDRQNRLYQDNFNANRLYQSELNQLIDDGVKRAYERETDKRYRTWTNLNNPYYQLDKRGMPVFNSQNAKDRFQADMQRINSGQGATNSSTISSYNNAYEHAYNNASNSLSEEEKRGLADDYARAVSGMKDRTKTTEKKGNKTIVQSAPGKKLGGTVNREALRRFITKR